MTRDTTRVPPPAPGPAPAPIAAASRRAPRPPHQPVAPGASTPRGPAGQRRAAGFGLRHPGLPAAAMDCAAVLAGAWPLGPGAGAYAVGPTVAVFLLANRRAGLYERTFAPSALDEVPALAVRAAMAWAPAAAMVAAADPGRALGWAALLVAVTVTAVAACLLRAVSYAIQRGYARRHPGGALIIGPLPAVRRIAAALLAHPEYGMRPYGLVVPGTPAPVPAAQMAASAPAATTMAPAPAADPPLRPLVAAFPAPAAEPQSQAHAPQLPPLLLLTGHGDLTSAVVRGAVRHALVVGPEALDHRTATAVRLLGLRGCHLWHLSAPPAAGTASRHRRGHLWGFACHPLEPSPYPWQRTGARPARLAKRALDAAAAGTALLVLTPVLAACALAVRLADGPGVLFRQERIGLGGRPFILLKFRTLRPSDEQESATRWTVVGDPRISAVGRLLRKTSMDELPQLWNVLRGDMSLVGPRPERPHFVREFERTHPGYRDRRRMPAGITGLAQVNGLRGDTSIADRARFDNHYIDTWSLWQDVTLLLRTVAAVFRFGGS
ncbi:sugar transferase [Actinacidiphila acididurans]|uniref:Sugar transferase n=1 Tax=Actinacidiphila acididurans TaxID=2784346 RepID=A0ABS2TR26_9ACTN|nr:sugar transferase [Actinacidiphila acididurans]MBM9505783.1 sugar transferase [Actinacidiphila acididurans]